MMHTQACLDRKEHIRIRRENYFIQWPNACRVCDATGGHEEVDYAFEPPAWFPCEVCENACPRCFVSVLDESVHENFINQNIACPFCGYDWERLDTDVPPNVVDGCMCDLDTQFGELP